jgi:hypothetical protein
MLETLPAPPVRYHDTHCTHTERARRAWMRALYASVARGVTVKVATAPSRMGFTNLRI